jgi:hypothetical protein
MIKIFDKNNEFWFDGKMLKLPKLQPHRPEHRPLAEAFADVVGRLVEAHHFGKINCN